MLFRRSYIALSVIAGLVTLLSSGQAQAQTVGTLMETLVTASSGMPMGFDLIAYVSGCFLSVAAIFKFKDSVDNPQQTPVSAGVKRLIAGGMFLSLPFMSSSVRNSILGNSNAAQTSSSVNTGGLTPGGMDELIVNFISDIYAPMTYLIEAFAYLAAIGLLIVGISRLTKRMEEGPRGPAGLGTMMTFLASGMLFSFGGSIAAFSQSIFGSSNSLVQPTIAADIITLAADRQKIEAVIGAVMVFVMLVGYIAFVRGWFVLKNFADGQSGATLAQGLTFLFGGALAINLGALVNAIQTTVNINGLTFS